MSLEENKSIIRRYVECVNKGQFDVLDDLVIPDFVDHNPVPGQEPGLVGAKKAYAMFRNAFPDAVFDLQDLIAEGDRVVGRGVMTGTHGGDFLGFPATGKKVTWTGIRIFTVKDGKVTEGWIDLDLLSVLQQIGAFPPPASPKR